MMINNELKKQTKEAVESVSVGFGKLFLHPAILLWMTPTLIYLFPVLAPLSVLGYWQWFGLYILSNWALNDLRRIIHG